MIINNIEELKPGAIYNLSYNDYSGYDCVIRFISIASGDSFGGWINGRVLLSSELPIGAYLLFMYNGKTITKL